MPNKPVSSPTLPPTPSDAHVLGLFPGNVRDAHRLYEAQMEIRRALQQVEQDFNLSTFELRAVLKPLVPPPMEFHQEIVDSPTEAPERWAERDLNRRETPPIFIRRVYGRWLGHGLARKDISRLDEELYRALSVWLTRHPDDEIAKQLPSQSEQIDDLIERLSEEYPVEFLRKLGYAIDSRMRRQAR